jgi:hypothetical protein
MFHVEMRMGAQVVREFNLSERRLWLELLEPLMSDRELKIEGHEFIPRQTRLKVYEGPELRPDQLGVGRGWQNVERSAADVTERVLTRARGHTGRARDDRSQVEVPSAPDLVTERMISRLGAGPISAQEILGDVADLMPHATVHEHTEVARQAVWQLLERDAAQLAPSGR